MNPSIVTQLLLALTLCALPVVGQSSKPGNAGNGKKLYIADGCYQCHGLQGQGGLLRAHRILRPHASLLRSFRSRQLRAYVRHPSGGMPPYTPKVLSDSQIDDIYAFLKTVPAPPQVKDIPLLNQ